MKISNREAGFVLKLLHPVANEKNDNLDIEVVLSDGRRYSATVSTIENLASIIKYYEQTGECLHGQYVWMKNLIVMRNLSPSSIEEAVADLIRNGEFVNAFGESL